MEPTYVLTSRTSLCTVLLFRLKFSYFFCSSLGSEPFDTCLDKPALSKPDFSYFSSWISACYFFAFKHSLSALVSNFQALHTASSQSTVFFFSLSFSSVPVVLVLSDIGLIVISQLQPGILFVNPD